MKYKNNDEVFGPREISFWDIWLNTVWAFISWIIWSVILLFIVFVISWIVDIPWNLKQANIWFWWNNPIFPFMLSFITFIVSIIVAVLTYNFLSLTDPNKYKKTIIHFSQISFFSIITYIFLVPVYVYAGMQDYNNIMYIFIVHVLLLIFWEVILLELLNNYRYILLWFYGSFVWLFLTGIIVFFIFSLFPEWYAKLLSLLLLLPIINWLIIFFKWLFEMIYYKYYIFTSKDNLWDIFKQIELEELEQVRDAENENNTY